MPESDHGFAPPEEHFLPGLKLSERLYQEWVRPALASHWPALAYSAALIGDGSEVLGFDTFRSMDHDWGPRLYLFLAEDDFHLAPAICRHLEEILPTTLAGHPIAFSDRDRVTAYQPESQACGSVRHGVECFALQSFFQAYLGQDVRQLQSPQAWLSLPEAQLRAVTAGAVFHDDLGLEARRRELHYYPHQIWLHLMACQWLRIAQEEAFVGRCWEVNDPLGAHLITARLCQNLMHLSFMQERRYRPYPKWWGSAFQELKAASALSPHLVSALQAQSFQEQEAALGAAYEVVATAHNQLKLTPALPSRPTQYHSRPYQVIHGEVFALALKAEISDPELKAFKRNIGSINQFVDSTDVLSHALFCSEFKQIIS